jgi:DNA-binding response OmpR family regulator
MVARILVAEDDRPLAGLIRDVLTEAGHDVVLVHDGRNAARQLEDPTLELVILDVLMPAISGDALGDKLALSRPELPVLLITGASGAPFLANTRHRILRKPFDPDQLLEQVGLLAR